MRLGWLTRPAVVSPVCRWVPAKDLGFLPKSAVAAGEEVEQQQEEEEEEEDDEDIAEDVEEEDDDDDEEDDEEEELEFGGRGKYQQMRTIGSARKSNRKILPGATLREWDA